MAKRKLLVKEENLHIEEQERQDILEFLQMKNIIPEHVAEIVNILNDKDPGNQAEQAIQSLTEEIENDETIGDKSKYEQLT
jgi:hypothetical protein